jgi:hypothetical protein
MAASLACRRTPGNSDQLELAAAEIQAAAD